MEDLVARAQIQGIIDNSIFVSNLNSTQSRDFLQTLWQNQSATDALATLNFIFPDRVVVEENGDVRILRDANGNQLFEI